jgi:polysaccharide biosynthesis/export protein
MRPHFFLISILLIAQVLGCAPVRPGAAKASLETPSASTSADYQVGPEDVLDITVWKEDGLKKEVLVRPDGGISFPLIGEVQAVGKTTGELQKEITQRLSKFIPRPSVNVALLKTASYKVYVMGRVNKPGEFTLGRRIDVLQALSMAGGLTPFAAASDIRVIRKTNGKEVSFKFDYNAAEKGQDLSKNIELKSGDTVVVP